MTAVTIVRSNPSVGYLEPDVFATLGFSQVVRAGETVYISGIAPLTGTAEALEIIKPGDMAGQITFVLDILERCLASEGVDLGALVAVTVYATDIDALVAEASLLQARFGEHAPTSTWVEIRKLVHPEQLIELTAVAVG